MASMETEHLKKYIGNQLRIHRYKAGLSQRQVSLQLNKTEQQISNWENGRYMPGLTDFVELMKLYDSSAGIILGLVPDICIQCGDGQDIPLSSMVFELLKRVKRKDFINLQELITDIMSRDPDQFLSKLISD